MTKDQLIALLQKSDLPGDASVRFACDAIVDGDPDQLVGDVTGIGERNGCLVIEGDGVDPDDRADWEAIYGDDDEDDEDGDEETTR
mgnify:CR=1 FL=1